MEVDREQPYNPRTPELFAEGQNQPDRARVDRNIDTPEHEGDGYFHRRSWLEQSSRTVGSSDLVLFCGVLGISA